MRIAVAGGTGVVGAHVVRAAEGDGHEVVTMSRATGVDVRGGEGMAAALDGVEVIVDVTNVATTRRTKATAFFSEVTANLQRTGAERGAARLVTLSIVGLEQVPGFGYYEAKQAQEVAARRGPLPARIVRATQFHEFAAQVLARGRRGPVAAVPTMTVQPVAARSVGQVLLEVAVEPDGPGMVEVAGPGRTDVVTMARAVVRRRGDRVTVVPLRVPGRAGKAMRAGALLPSGEARLVGPAFDRWLDGPDPGAVRPGDRPG